MFRRMIIGSVLVLPLLACAENFEPEASARQAMKNAKEMQVSQEELNDLRDALAGTEWVLDRDFSTGGQFPPELIFAETGEKAKLTADAGAEAKVKKGNRTGFLAGFFRRHSASAVTILLNSVKSAGADSPCVAKLVLEMQQRQTGESLAASLSTVKSCDGMVAVWGAAALVLVSRDIAKQTSDLTTDPGVFGHVTAGTVMIASAATVIVGGPNGLLAPPRAGTFPDAFYRPKD